EILSGPPGRFSVACPAADDRSPGAVECRGRAMPGGMYGLDAMGGQNNRWVYCSNDPVNFTDPSGMIGEQFWFGLGLTIGLGVGGYIGFRQPQVARLAD